MENLKKTVTFTLTLENFETSEFSYTTEEQFTLKQLGYDPLVHHDLESFVGMQYVFWRSNLLSGGWELEE